MKTKKLDDLKSGDSVIFIKDYYTSSKELFAIRDRPVLFRKGHKMIFYSFHKMEPISASIIYFDMQNGTTKTAFSPMSLSKYIQPLSEFRK